MKEKLESILKKGKMAALAGVAALAIGCASMPPATTVQQQENTSQQQQTNQEIASLTFKGKTLSDYFKDFNSLEYSQQQSLAEKLNELSAWDTVLLARYIPLDGIAGKLSSFYSTDYKWYIQSLLSESGLDPTTVSGSDKGLGQISVSSEKWAKELYSNPGYKFSGAGLEDNLLDPYTNLVLSSIIFRKASEENIKDPEALYAIYTKGYGGVNLENGQYVVNDVGMESVNRAKTFDSISDKMIIFSWISTDNQNMARYVEDSDLRRALRLNNSNYDGESAYRGIIGFLNSQSSNKKYSEEMQKMFKDEATKVSVWVNQLYGK